MHPFSYPTPRCYSIPLLLDNHPSYLRCTVRLVRTPPSAAHNTPSLVSIQSLKYNVVSAKLPAVLEALTGTTSRRPCRLSVRYVICNIHDIKHPPRSTIHATPGKPTRTYHRMFAHLFFHVQGPSPTWASLLRREPPRLPLASRVYQSRSRRVPTPGEAHSLHVRLP